MNIQTCDDRHEAISFTSWRCPICSMKNDNLRFVEEGQAFVLRTAIRALKEAITKFENELVKIEGENLSYKRAD